MSNNPILRQIIHLDLDAFYCAVEQILDPSLRGKAFAVGGRPGGRGVVTSCSYAARAYGVHAAMPSAQAVRMCPDLILVSSHFQAYGIASKKVMTKLRELTPQMEQISIDEAFLDVTSLPINILIAARKLQADIYDHLQLPCSLGIASNKLVAKIANDVGKAAAKGVHSPMALTLVPPGDEAQFLAPLPVEMLWGVGPKTARKLAALNIETIGDLAAQDEIELMRRYGKIGHDLSRRAKGIDNRPIVIERDIKSISQEITFSKDMQDPQKLRQTITKQANKISNQLQKKDMLARTIKIKVRWPDFTTITRQKTLMQPTNDREIIFINALQLFEYVWQPGKFVRLLGVGTSGLENPAQQIGLWDVDWEKEHRLQSTMAKIRNKYGDDVLSRGLPDKSKNNTKS
ncbi:MAG: DNA polymerase IV [Anaerolineae bacterium]|nr:DNA polymerase IV [Anaerolineae bacterium]